MIRLSKHQVIEVKTPDNLTTITPQFGSKLTIKVTSTEASNNRTITPKGHDKVRFQVMCGNKALDLAVWLNPDSMQWMLEFYGDRWFEVKRRKRVQNEAHA